MSLAIAYAGHSRAVVSSDDKQCGQYTRLDDKTALFDAGPRTLVGIGGLLLLKPMQLDTQEFREFPEYIPRRVAGLCSDERLRDRPRDLLEAIRDDLHEPLLSSFQKYPDTFQWILGDHKVIFQAFSVRRRPGGQVDLLQLMFPMSEVDGRAVLHEPEIDVFCDAVPGARGPAYCAGGFDSKLPGLPPNPNYPDDQILAGMDRLYKIASDLDDAIGVPHQIAVIEETGIRWLRKAFEVMPAGARA